MTMTMMSPTKSLGKGAASVCVASARGDHARVRLLRVLQWAQFV